MNRTKSIALAFIFLSVSALCVFEVQPVSAAEDTWTAKQPMPTARSGLGVAVVNGKIYAIGGDGGSNVTEEYNPVTNIWTEKKPMPTGRGRFGIATYQNKIYVIGGHTADNGFTDVTEVYDPLTNAWEAKKPLPTGARAELTANVVNGKIYVVGGYFYGAYMISSNTLEVYEPETDTWTTKAPMLTAVYSCTSAVANNKIYVMENSFQDRGGSLNQIYNTENDSWSYGHAIPVGAAGAAAAATTAVFAPKRVYLMGGATTTNSSNQVYNPENDSWSVGAPILTERNYLGVAVVEDVLYAVGGSDLAGGSVNATEQYMPVGYGSTPPRLNVVSPESKAYNVSSIPIAFTSNKQLNWSGYSVDGWANATVDPEGKLKGLSDGNHSFVVYANDTLGNMGSSNVVQFSVDTKSPIILIQSPEDKVYDANEISLNFTVGEAVSWLAYSLDGEENVTIDKNTTLAGLTDGAHTVRIYANDTVGNMGASATVNFRIEPFPTILVVAVSVTAVIVILAAFLFLRRRKAHAWN